MSRGVIQHRRRALQERDFSGLRFSGGITPTDIDAAIDFGNQAFVFVEAKYGDAPVAHGQRVAIERICDACNRGGVPTLGLVGVHHQPVSQAVDYGAMWVTEYRWNGRWWRAPGGRNVRTAIDGFLSKQNRARMKESA